MCQGYTKVTLIRFRITDLTRRYKNFISTNGSRASGIIIRMYLYHRFFILMEQIKFVGCQPKTNRGCKNRKEMLSSSKHHLRKNYLSLLFIRLSSKTN